MHTTFKRWNRSVSSDQFVGNVVSFAVAVSQSLSWLQSSTASPCAALGRRGSPARRAWRSHAHVPTILRVGILPPHQPGCRGVSQETGRWGCMKQGGSNVSGDDELNDLYDVWFIFLLGVYYYQLGQANRQLGRVGRGRVPFMWCVCMGGIQKLASR